MYHKKWVKVFSLDELDAVSPYYSPLLRVETAN